MEIILGVSLIILGLLWHKYTKVIVTGGFMKEDRKIRKHMITFFLILLGILNVFGKTSILFGLGLIE